jgi:tetratricopeptide (TPR) repeat protein
MKEDLAYSLIGKELNQQLVGDPNNIAIYQNLAMVYQHMGKFKDAMVAYEKIIDLDPQQAVSLNNLAWLLVTAPNEDLRDKTRALELAKKAVGLERSPVFLDTLAEAYYANGLIREAVQTIEQAITIETGNTDYYEKQLRKFLASKD